MLLYCSKMGMLTVSRLATVCFFWCVTTVFFVVFFTRGLPANTTSEQACSDVMCNRFLMVYACVSFSRR